MAAICLSCGCGSGDDSHGGSGGITFGRLQAAADAAGISLARAAANILQTVTGTLEDNDPEPEGPVQKFLFGAAYQPNKDPRIQRGQDGGRDWISPRELERGAWNFMLNGQQHGAFHMEGTEGIAKTVESGIYRNPIPWIVSDDLIIRKGTWTIGVLVNDAGWDAYKEGRFGGFSPQGVARRRGARP